MFLLHWCQWLQHTAFATAISESSWLFPVIEGSHILFLSCSVGIILILDLRLIGLAFRGQPAARLMKQLMPWSWAGFAAMFTTGGILFVTQAGKAYGNFFFRTKLVLLLLLGLNAAIYHVKFYPKMAEWDAAQGAPVGAKLCALFSLLAWVSVIVCGRTMAYQF